MTPLIQNVIIINHNKWTLKISVMSSTLLLSNRHLTKVVGFNPPLCYEPPIEMITVQSTWHIIIQNRCMSQGLKQYPMVTSVHSVSEYTQKRLPCLSSDHGAQLPTLAQHEGGQGFDSLACCSNIFWFTFPSFFLWYFFHTFPTVTSGRLGLNQCYHLLRNQ